jgi:micrococcal nuclease
MSKRRPKKSIIATVMALLLAGGAGTGYVLVRDNAADIFEHSLHEVVRVVDGDTVVLANEVRVRLLGINAPERDECLFEESSAYLHALVADTPVRLRKDISGSDQYERLLRYLFVPSETATASDVFVNYELVRQGFARTQSVSPDTQYRDLLASAEKEAREEELGGWLLCNWLDEYTSARPTAATDSLPPSPECVIKGNISEKSFGKNYFVPGCPNYNVIKISPEKGEQYFCTEEEALAAGFTRSASCR